MTLRARLAAVAMLVGLGLVFTGPSAFAHAALDSSNPRDGARLDRAPEAVTLSFTEPPELSLSRVMVLDPSGRSVSSGPPEIVEADELSLRVPVETLPKGSYTVSWRTVSKADGHASAGVFAFGVGTAALDSGVTRPSVPESPPTSTLEVLGRVGLLVGLTGLLGGAGVAAWVFGGTPVSIRNYAMAGLGAAAIGVALLTAAQQEAAASGLSELFATSIGRALALRGFGLVAAAAGLIVVWRWPDRARAGYVVAAGGAAGAMLAHVAAGHAAADASFGWIEIFSQWIHFAAVAIWLGGLAALLLGIRRVAGADRARYVKRFSTLAGLLLVIVAVTGTFRAINEIRGWDELFGSSYGRVVLVKAGLLIALIVLGGINRYRNVPRAESSLSGLFRISRAELAIAVLTLSAAALLASLAPPQEGTAQASPPSSVVATGSDFTTSVRARIEVTPGTAGSNRFSLRLVDYDTGDPFPARRVTARFTFLDRTGIAESTLSFRRIGHGAYQASGSNLSLQGEWRATVTAQRAADSFEIPLRITTACGARATTDPGSVPVYTVDLPNGGSLQGYVDPQEPGLNQVHATFLDQVGGELRVGRDVTMRAALPDGHRHSLKVRRLSRGHFVANTTLDAGEWRFEVSVTDGESRLGGCFEATL